MLTTNNISPKSGTKLDDIMTRLSEPMKIDLSVLNSITRESGFMRHLRISLIPSQSEAGESTADHDEDQLRQSRRISRRRIHGRFEDQDEDSTPESAAGGIAPSEGRKSEESTIAITCHDFLPKFLDDGCLSKCITMSDSMPSRNIPMCLHLDRAVSSTDSAIKRNNNNNNINTPIGAPPHAPCPAPPMSAVQAIISMGINVHPSTLGINASHSNERHRTPPTMGTTTSPCPPAPEPTKLSLDAFFPTGTAPAPAPAPPASYPMHSRGLPQRPWEKTNTSTMSPVLNNVNVNVPAVGAHNTQRIHQQQPICLSLANMMAPETKSESSSTPMNNNVGTGAGAGAGAGAGIQKEIVSLESMLGGEACVNKHDNGDTPTTTTTSGRGVTESNGSTLNHTKVTTMMIRNLPKEMTQSQLLKLLNETGFRTQYDFVYLPCCFTKKINIGYAFVNFLSRTVAYNFRDIWQNSSFFHKETQGREPTSTINVTVAQVQGKEMNIKRLIHECRCSKITNPKFQPVVYENGVRVNFIDFARIMVKAEDEVDKVLREV